MAANISSFLSKIASLGLGVAVAGGVVNTALYNSERYTTVKLFIFETLNLDQSLNNITTHACKIQFV